MVPSAPKFSAISTLSMTSSVLSAPAPTKTGTLPFTVLITHLAIAFLSENDIERNSPVEPNGINPCIPLSTCHSVNLA